MKLNYKRTILVGMAFFLISAFWQAYDAIIPLILTNHFGLPQSVSGAVTVSSNTGRPAAVVAAGAAVAVVSTAGSSVAVLAASSALSAIANMGMDIIIEATIIDITFFITYTSFQNGVPAIIFLFRSRDCIIYPEMGKRVAGL